MLDRQILKFGEHTYEIGAVQSPPGRPQGRLDMQLTEPFSASGAEALGVEPLQEFPTPKRQRLLPTASARILRLGVFPLGPDHRLELPAIGSDLTAEPIPTTNRLDFEVMEISKTSPQPRDVGPHEPRSWTLPWPEDLQQPVGRDGYRVGTDQTGEQLPLNGRRDFILDRNAIDPERPQILDLNHATRPNRNEQHATRGAVRSDAKAGRTGGEPPDVTSEP